MKHFWLIAPLTLFCSASAMAEIIILQGGGLNFQYGATVAPSFGMSTIVINQPFMYSSPILQRSHAWSTYQKGNIASGAGLIVPPYTGTESDAQLSVYRNMSRAHSFRLGY